MLEDFLILNSREGESEDGKVLILQEMALPRLLDTSLSFRLQDILLCTMSNVIAVTSFFGWGWNHKS